MRDGKASLVAADFKPRQLSLQKRVYSLSFLGEVPGL